jgi:hypothetical protein
MDFKEIVQEGDWLGEWIESYNFAMSFELQIFG